ncbi:MAG: UTP--glucose-1-phosphate uridylyltransferase [Candidatus Binatia bacterium]
MDAAASDPALEAAFAPFAARMAAAAAPPIAVRNFRHAYAQLLRGDTGLVRGADALPPTGLADLGDLAAYEPAGRAALGRAVLIKLNGGLGTSMGLRGPKSLLPVKDGLTFLDIIARQVLHLRAATGARLPVLFMNSFATQGPTRAALAAYPALAVDGRLDFEQHQVPKVRADDLTPVDWPAEPAAEWCPPGHGDLYPALDSSGALDALLGAGYEHAFVSNADNLGATLHLGLLGWCAAEAVPFALEVTARTILDRKGGHLAQRPDGALLLRELAQCPPDELDAFQDIERYAWFNTNNLWLHLPTLRAELDRRGGVLGLPLIRNRKHVDPVDPTSPLADQLETAMGAAVGVIPGARAVRVPRLRFAPVKRTDDLLLVRSDVYRLDDSWRIVPAPAFAAGGRALPAVRLDDEHWRTVADLDRGFPHGAPSLAECRSLRLSGPFRFGRDVAVVGDVALANAAAAPVVIPDGTRLG